MSTENIITLIIVALGLFVWLPAIIWSVRRVFDEEKKQKQDNNGRKKL